MNNTIKNYIFDLDGTLINSCNEVLECFKKAFDKTGYPIDKSRLTDNLIGPPLKDIIKNIAPELDDENILNEITLNFRDIYDNDTNDVSVLYDGVMDVLTRLKESGKKVFLATLKPTKPTRRILRDFMPNIFDDVYTIDKFQKTMTKKEMILDIINKYDLSESETVMIGDAPTDVISANEAGIISIGALWGYGDNKDDLIKNSRYVIKGIEELECLKM